MAMIPYLSSGHNSYGGRTHMKVVPRPARFGLAEKLFTPSSITLSLAFQNEITLTDAINGNLMKRSMTT